MLANGLTLILFVLSRTYSNLLNRFLLVVSGKSKEIQEMDSYLVYPPKIDLFEKKMEATFGLRVESRRSEVKATLKNRTYFELITLHKYYNTVLNTTNSVLVFHEILRKNSRIRALLRPYGVRRYLAAHLMLGGIGIKTPINASYGRRLIFLLNQICSFGRSMEFNVRVFNKTISVVGGAPSPRNNKQDIVECDLVVRLNREHPLEERTDIVYFRAEKLEHMYQNGRLDSIGDMGVLASLKTFRYYFRLRYLNSLKGVSPTPSLDAAFDCGKLNAVPTVCLDLVSKSPKNIFIFDTDLNLSKQHKDGYRDPEQPSVNFTQIFGEHPGYIQFIVLKYMNSLGLVQFEENSNFNIEWGYLKFLRALKYTYGSE